MAIVGLLASLLVQVGLLTPAAHAARLVANPGSFSIQANSGAAKIGSQSFTFEGSQADQVSFTGTIDSSGNISVPGSGIQFPSTPVSAGGFDLTVHIRGVGASGTINPTTGVLNMTVQLWIKIDGVPLGGGCRIASAGSPITIPVSTNGVAPSLSPNQGSPYNPATGNFVIANNTFSVPGASDCGVANGTVNSEVGIPSGSGANELVIDGNLVPAFQPHVINLTANPNPVVVNKPTTLSAAGTTTTGLVRFDWDLDGNGTYETTGTATATRNHTFTTTGTKTVGVLAVYTDGNNATKTTTVSVVNNSAPVVPTQNLTTNEEVALPITLAATDANGDPLTYSVLTTPPPATGTLTGTPPNLTYTPATNYNANTSFTYSVNDGNGGVTTGTVNIDVIPVNDAPDAQNGTLAVTEDVDQPVTLVATDVDGDALTYAVTGQGTKGTVTCAPPGSNACTYDPNDNATGADTFTFSVSDGNGGTDSATFNVTIGGVNDVPEVDDIEVTTAEDIAATITLEGDDPDGDTLTFTPTSLPAHGSLTGTPPNLTYTPAPNYNGPDSFTFSANDGNGGVVAATVDITVTATNDPPVAVDTAVSTPEGQAANFQLVATDIDGTDTLVFTPTSAANGIFACPLTDGACSYTPNPGFAGTDVLTFTVDDGNGGTDTGTVTVTVAALVNFAPVITTPASLAVLEDTPRTINLTATDGDGDPVTFTVLTGPANGTLSGSGSTRTYTPATNANGTESIVVQASDGRGGLATKTIALTIVPINDAPVAVAQSFTLDQDTSTTVDLVASDAEGDALTWTRKTGPGHGTASVSGDDLTYTPAAGFVGTDTVEVEASDPSGARHRVTITFVVADVDEAPIAGTLAVTVVEDGTAFITLPASDPDGGALTVTEDDGSLGTLSCTDLDCTYTPNTNANGVDTVPFTVTDGDDVSATGSVVVTIQPQADDPVAQDQTVTAAPGQTIDITLSAIDPDGGTLGYAVTAAPAGGTVGGTPPAITYTAPASVGTRTIGFTATDPTGRADTGVVTVIVQPQPQPPTAGDQSLATPEDTNLPITLVGSDPDGGVTFAYGQPAHCTVSGSAPFVNYLPAANYNGPDSFAFTVTDGQGNVATGTISINVTPVNDRPTAVGGTAATTRTAPVNITLSASDIDGDALTYSVSSGPNHGTLTIAGNVATYTPTGLYTGPDAFTFRATDPGGKFGSATVIITVTQGGNLGTQLVQVSPATGRKVGLALQWTYTNLNARLTVPAAGGTPLVGQLIQFKTGATVICSATTDATGLAACSGMGPLLAAKATSYTAVYAGSPGFNGTSGGGGIS